MNETAGEGVKAMAVRMERGMVGEITVKVIIREMATGLMAWTGVSSVNSLTTL